MQTRTLGCRGRLARWLAYLLGAIVVLSLPLTLLARASSQVLFDPLAMTTILDQHLIQSGLLKQVVVQGLFSRQTDGELTASDLGRLMTYAGEQDRQAVAELIVPPDWAQAQLGQVVQGFYAWLNSDAPAPEFNLDLAAIRENLSSGGVDQIVDLATASWPACTSDQIAQMHAELTDSGVFPSMLCVPPGPEAGQMMAQLKDDLHAMVGTIPDRLPAGSQVDPDTVSQLVQARRILNTIQLVSTWAWLVPGALLGLIVALVARSWTAVFKWCGTPLLAGGLAGMAMAAAGSWYGLPRAHALIEAQLVSMPPPVQAAMLEIAMDLVRQINGTFFVLSVVAAGVAGIFVLAGVLRTASSAPPADGSIPARSLAESSSDPASGMFG